jgi:hypothetical protein
MSSSSSPEATFYKDNDDNDNNNKPKRNRGDTIFAITFISAAILVTLEILFLWAGP